MKTITSLSQLLETVADLSYRTIIDVAADSRQTVVQQGEPLVVSADVFEPKPDAPEPLS